MTCNHKPRLSFKLLMTNNPKSVCRHCGEKIEMAPPFNLVSKILASVMLAAMLLKVLSNTAPFGTTGTTRLFADIGILLGLFVLYFGLSAALAMLARYQPVKTEEQPTPDQQPGEQPAAQQLTAEQQELIALYQSYEKQAGLETAAAQPTAEAAKIAEEDTCGHVLKASWKNYIPGQGSFTCATCGQPITFPADLRKRYNMLLTVLSFVILVPLFMDQTMAFWIFGLATLGVLAVGTLIQIYFLRKAKFIIDPNPPTRRNKRA